MTTQVIEQIKITKLTRKNNSFSGNPRWAVAFSNGLEAITKRDAAVGHVIANEEFQGVPLDVTIEDGYIAAVMRS